MNFERLVKSFEIPPKGSEIYGPICAGDYYDKLVYYEQCLGDYSIDWILCYRNGVVVTQYNVRYVESIAF